MAGKNLELELDDPRCIVKTCFLSGWIWGSGPTSSNAPYLSPKIHLEIGMKQPRCIPSIVYGDGQSIANKQYHFKFWGWPTSSMLPSLASSGGTACKITCKSPKAGNMLYLPQQNSSVFSFYIIIIPNHLNHLSLTICLFFASLLVLYYLDKTF